MIDQYGNEIPNDLVYLPEYNNVIADFIFSVDWYSVGGDLCCSAEQIEYLSEEGPEDIFQVFKINDCLKRGNAVDGFYHA